MAATDVQHLVVPLALHIENTGSLSISDVDVVWDFPTEALIEKSGVVGPFGGEVAAVSFSWSKHREVIRYRGMAQSRLALGLIRPGEKTVTAELFQLRDGFRLPISSDPTSGERLQRRFEDCKALRAILEIHVSIWSSSSKPVSFPVLLLWLTATSDKDLESQLVQLGVASAKEAPIKPGVYIKFPWEKLLREEFLELALLRPTSVGDLANLTSHEGLAHRILGAVKLRLPPWGLTGPSFDLRQTNFRLWPSRDKSRVSDRDLRDLDDRS